LQVVVVVEQAQLVVMEQRQAQQTQAVAVEQVLPQVFQVHQLLTQAEAVHKAGQRLAQVAQGVAVMVVT
jgi:hypothetical protein